MSVLEELLERPQFSIGHKEKSRLLLSGLEELTAYHRRNCAEYDRILSLLDGDRQVADLAAVPYLPATLFKTHALRSVPENEIFKTLTSSGTTGQQASRIVLDRETARLQSTALSKIMMHVLGPRRLPMILIESSGLIKNRESLSARGGGAGWHGEFRAFSLLRSRREHGVGRIGITRISGAVWKRALPDVRLHFHGLAVSVHADSRFAF